MEDLTLDEAMEELVSAEDFLEFFEIEFEPSVVHVNRLHILQRFHSYVRCRKTGDGSREKRGLYRHVKTGLSGFR